MFLKLLRVRKLELAGKRALQQCVVRGGHNGTLCGHVCLLIFLCVFLQCRVVDLLCWDNQTAGEYGAYDVGAADKAVELIQDKYCDSAVSNVVAEVRPLLVPYVAWTYLFVLVELTAGPPGSHPGPPCIHWLPLSHITSPPSCCGLCLAHLQAELPRPGAGHVPHRHQGIEPLGFLLQALVICCVCCRSPWVACVRRQLGMISMCPSRTWRLLRR